LKKIEEAQDILRSIGLPARQYNDSAALTFLALGNIKEEDSWADAKAVRLRIHDIIIFISKYYNISYAENTRETIRRQVIHQFEQARVVDKNPDDSTLSTNSPRSHYALTEEMLTLIKNYGSIEWKNNIEKFKNKNGALSEIYQKKRQMEMIPIHINDGDELYLSPGKHNQLQVKIIEDFAPRFAPGSRIVYMGDTANKMLFLDETIFKDIQVPVSEHDKLPDVVLYNKISNRIFLIEAVTSHGPVSPKRQFELEQVLSNCTAEKIYISAFLDFKEFKRHLEDIAWETEVWISEINDHLIHFNGDKFL
jgi:type II restriction enzyme